MLKVIPKVNGTNYSNNSNKSSSTKLAKSMYSVYYESKRFNWLKSWIFVFRYALYSKKKYKNVYYVREPVEIGHRLGYLKGTEEDKYGPYLGPLLDNYNHLMVNVKSDPSSPYREPKKNAKYMDEDRPIYENLPSDIVPIAPEFIRGRSFSDAILIVDEAQNLTLDELHTLATRLGSNSKMIVIGSPNQIDVDDQTFEKNAFETSYKILEPTGLVGFVELKAPMRSGFVTDFDQRFLQYKLKEGKKR